MRPHKALPLLIAIAALTGCDQDIESIKSSRLEFNDTYTIDQAFSNREICEHVTWTTKKDSRDRKLVQYRCEIKGASEYIRAQKEQTRLQIANETEANKEFLARKESEAREAYLKEQESNHRLKESTDTTPESIEKQVQNSPEVKNIKNLLSSLNQKEAQGFSISSDAKNYLSLSSKTEKLSDISQKLGFQKARAASRPSFSKSAEKDNEYIENLSKQYKEEAKRLIPIINSELELTIKSKTEEIIKDAKLALQESEYREEKALERYEQARIETQEKSKLADLKALKRIAEVDQNPAIEKVTEIFEWVIKGDEIEIVNRKIEHTDSNSKASARSLDIMAGLRQVYENDARNYADFSFFR
ncbi:hypothetical protein HW090_17510 [Pseudomonas sp. ABC1]|uniref:hypothetical protein n=1 Tax=Pseudomonas sp. ABC1 TaxID=2748080 RepID=UPI0015C37A85|nr:hypothetical protein [Pseudomonas sp. ABC1]QLF94882.1 hypothetical protein HW090_17510 [Pseudomonas sp. ABC1]